MEVLQQAIEGKPRSNGRIHHLDQDPRGHYRQEEEMKKCGWLDILKFILSPHKYFATERSKMATRCNANVTDSKAKFRKALKKLEDHVQG